MPPTAVTTGDVAHAIQLALAPVFLLTGIAGILNVMAGRLGRIIDRGRALTETPLAALFDDAHALQASLEMLEHRRHLASHAITACTFGALLVCTTIATLFVEVLMHVELGFLVGALFTAATLAVVLGLTYFLREVHLATQTVRILPAQRSERKE